MDPVNTRLIDQGQAFNQEVDSLHGHHERAGDNDESRGRFGWKAVLPRCAQSRQDYFFTDVGKGFQQVCLSTFGDGKDTVEVVCQGVPEAEVVQGSSKFVKVAAVGPGDSPQGCLLCANEGECQC